MAIYHENTLWSEEWTLIDWDRLVRKCKTPLLYRIQQRSRLMVNCDKDQENRIAYHMPKPLNHTVFNTKNVSAAKIQRQICEEYIEKNHDFKSWVIAEHIMSTTNIGVKLIHDRSSLLDGKRNRQLSFSRENRSVCYKRRLFCKWDSEIPSAARKSFNPGKSWNSLLFVDMQMRTILFD